MKKTTGAKKETNEAEIVTVTEKALPVKRGRPFGTGKYKEEYVTELLDLMSEGLLDCEIYAQWSITKETFYTWLREKSDLKEAYDQGIQICEAWWVGQMRRCFLERDDKGFKYCIAIMNNKFGWEKGSKQSDQTVTNVTINQMNVLQNKSRTNLIDFIKNSLHRNRDVIDVNELTDQSRSVE